MIKKMLYSVIWLRVVYISSTLLYFETNLKYANQDKWEKCQIKLVFTLDVWAVKDPHFICLPVISSTSGDWFLAIQYSLITAKDRD